MNSKLLKVILLILVMCFSFTGCLSSNLGVDETIVIQAIGVDFDLNEKQYEVTMQCFDLSKTSSKGEGVESPITKTITTKGNSIEEAISNTTKITGVNPIYSQNRLIVLGESVLKNGINTAFDVFIRNYRTRSSVPIAISKDFKAADIINASEDGISPLPASTMEDVLRSGEINSYTKLVTVLDIVKLYEEKTTSVYFPVITLDVKDEQTYVKLDGMGILKDKKIYEYLSNDETRAMLWVIDEINSATIVLEKTQVGIASFDIADSKTKIDTQITSDGSLQYNIKIDCSVDLMEIDFNEHYMLSENEIKELEKNLNSYIENQVEKILEKCLSEYKCDPFRFGQRLWQESPESYRKLSDNWEKFLPNLKTQINVNTSIRRVGRYGFQK